MRSTRQLRSLTDFINRHKLLFGIVVNQAQEITWLTRQVVQIPAGYL